MLNQVSTYDHYVFKLLNVLSEVMGLHRWPSHSRQPFNFIWDTSVINDSFWHVEFITSSRNFPLTLYTLLYAKETDGQFSCSVMFNSLQPHGCSTPGLPVHQKRPEFTQTHVHWVGHDVIQPSHPLSTPSLPAFNLYQHYGLFKWVSSLSFIFNISPSNEYSGLISFRMNWLDLLAVQGTLKSLLQHHGSKASILRCSTFFIETDVK